ncbi:MAG: hypothetical protein FD153_789 [Rhodospirillaceae bacterium]|nr:MAG: hypothetical protein FD153_789 [Rhodospirillaceae bacterium]
MALLYALYPESSTAKDIFTIDAVMGPQSAHAGYSRIEDMINALDSNGSKGLVLSYGLTSAATAILSIREVPATVSYEADSITLNFMVARLGTDPDFTGATRDKTQAMFEDYLKKNGGGILQRLLREAVGSTSIDSIAGNPNSLMAMIGAADFDNARATSAASGTAAAKYDCRQPDSPRGTVQPVFGRWIQPECLHAAPWVHDFLQGPRYALTIDIPLALTQTASANAYSGSLGLALHLSRHGLMVAYLRNQGWRRGIG